MGRATRQMPERYVRTQRRIRGTKRTQISARSVTPGPPTPRSAAGSVIAAPGAASSGTVRQTGPPGVPPAKNRQADGCGGGWPGAIGNQARYISLFGYSAVPKSTVARVVRKTGPVGVPDHSRRDVDQPLPGGQPGMDRRDPCCRARGASRP